MSTKYQIFISSTFDDLKEERSQVIKAILEMGHIPVGMEMFSAADEEQWKLIARQIDETDYYVVIVGHRYGSMIDGISYTEKEFAYQRFQKRLHRRSPKICQIPSQLRNLQVSAATSEARGLTHTSSGRPKAFGFVPPLMSNVIPPQTPSPCAASPPACRLPASPCP